MLTLTSILSTPESSYLEGKSAKGGFPDSFWESYSAFANSDGGTIVLGVEEDVNGNLCVKDGLKDAQKMKETFWKLVNNRQKISHNIVLEKGVYILEADGNTIYIFKIDYIIQKNNHNRKSVLLHPLSGLRFLFL